MLVQPNGNEQTHHIDIEQPQQVSLSKPIASENADELAGSNLGGEIAKCEGSGLDKPLEQHSSHEHLENVSNGVAKKSNRKQKNTLRPSVGSERVLRSKVQEKPKSVEANTNGGGASAAAAVNVGNEVAAKKTRGRKKVGAQRAVPDEYSRIKKRLRYFLHRIQYEQNLIDAYSSEGWKGSSLEKLKPEKELQRATSEILRRKLKIRDLFQYLDSLCAEGRFPKSIFDSDGQIDSEDIFCAKCGSKDLLADNDIILCDGACDRGFHQFCLEPPLLSDDIPPGDEGWLCPGCDCKVDCIDLLNDSHDTDLSVNDSWEKVFAEEAAAAAAARDGQDRDHNLDDPSDDSDDDDYDPDAPVTAEKSVGDESSGSDESDYSSDDSSTELETEAKDEQNPEGLPSDDSEDADFDPNAPDDDENENPRTTVQQPELNLGLSSDDSEDDNYDPDAPDMDDDIKRESSSSDFTSDSEDLEVDVPSSDEKESKRGRSGPKSALEDELLGILDGSLPLPPRRHVERLDYKRLHDETYGNLPSESSDNEDYGSTAPRKRARTTGKTSSSFPNGNSLSVENGTTMETVSIDPKDNEHTPRRSMRRNSPAKDTNSSVGKPFDDSPSAGSSSRKTKSSSNRRLGEAVTQRLYKSFKENQYPDRATKESLAEELGITVLQVSKWFGNMRWSWRHSSSVKGASQHEKSPKESKSALSPQANKQLVELEEQDTNIRNPTSNGTQNVEPPKEASSKEGQKLTTLTSRQKRGRARNKSPETLAIVSPSETGVRTRARQRKSAS